MAETQVRRIVRIVGTDIDGTLSTERALRKIHGVSFMLSRAVCSSVEVDGNEKLGLLDEAKIKSLEELLKSTSESKLPKWMLNRRKDLDTGQDLHLVGDRLKRKNSDDINLLRRMRSRRGIRHELGLPVRGQRTRSTGRKAKSVGVVRKREKPGAKPTPAGKK